MNKDTIFFNTNKYLLVKNALTKSEADLAYRTALFHQIQNPKMTDDWITPLTATQYASPITESILVHMLPIIEQKTGLTLLPTYSYHRIYKPGDFLKKHTDRLSCEIGATINLGYDYIIDDPEYRWNIWVGDKEFITEPGDMIIYKGIELEHWRDTFNAKEGSTHVQAFIFYVDANGPYKDLIYDGRPELGYSEEYRELPSNYIDWRTAK